jgi:hypothetical protein
MVAYGGAARGTRRAGVLERESATRHRVPVSLNSVYPGLTEFISKFLN